MVPRITGLLLRTAEGILPPMFSRHRSDPTGDVGAALREHVRRLERPEPKRTEAARVRICLARPCPHALRERNARAA
jgi:hypothetical protein